MPTYKLKGTESTALPQRALSVSMSVDAARGGGARLVSRAVVGPSPVIEDRPDLVIVPYVDSEVVIAAVPVGGAHFAEQTTLFLSIAPDTRDPNVDTIQVAAHDVSGQDSVDLVTLAPDGDQVVVTRVGGGEIPLSKLANRARVACRGALGVNAFEPIVQVTVGCVIDTSASMARWVGNGAVGAATDVFAGIAAALSPDREPRTVLADLDGTDVTTGALSGLRGRVRDAIATRGFGLGADMDTAIAKVSSSAEFTVVITDAPIGVAARPGRVSSMSLSESRFGPQGLEAALLPPPPIGVDADEFYNANPHIIDAAVAALVAPLRSSR